MIPLFEKLMDGFSPKGVLRLDAAAFLVLHGYPQTARHCQRVAVAARELAVRFGADAEQAEAAGHLHDVSAVFPSPIRLTVARQLDLDVLPEEALYPMILHQKLSVVLAAQIFGVNNPFVLSAIGCHTTLKAQASLLDKVVFVADKLEWDGVGEQPYRQALLAALDRSLDAAAWSYLDYLWQMRDQLSVLHPWVAAAYHELGSMLAQAGLL